MYFQKVKFSAMKNLQKISTISKEEISQTDSKSFLKSDNLGRSPSRSINTGLVEENGDKKFVSPYQGKYQLTINNHEYAIKL